MAEILNTAIKNQGKTIAIKMTAPRILESVEKNMRRESVWGI
jgi:hypothetical protein